MTDIIDFSYMGLFPAMATDIACGVYPINKDSLLRALTIHIFGVVAREPSHIISSSKNLYKEYFIKALEYLEEDKDSGLLPEGLLEFYHQLEDDEKTHLSTYAGVFDDISSFPHLEKLNIVAVQHQVSLDIGADIVPATIPVILQSKGGLAGVIPSVLEDDGFSGHIYSTLMPHKADMNISNIHVWQLEHKQIRPGKNPINQSIEDIFDHVFSGDF